MNLFQTILSLLFLTIFCNHFVLLCSQYSPLGTIIKDTVDYIGNIRKTVQQHIQAKNGGYDGSTGYSDYDYGDSSDAVQQFCEYLKNGKLYRGPCGQQKSASYTSAREDKYARRIERLRQKEQRREERRRWKEAKKAFKYGGHVPGPTETIKKVIVIQPDEVEHEEDPDRYNTRENVVNLRENVNNNRFDNNNNRPNNNVAPIRNPEPIRNREPVRNPEPSRPNRDHSDMTPCQTIDGISGLCMPASYCFAQYGGNLEDYRGSICERLDSGVNGICCPIREDRVRDRFNNPITPPRSVKPSMKIGFISLEDINVAAKEANEFIEEYIRQERELLQNGIMQRQGSMQSMHQAFFGDFDPVQFQLTVGGFINLLTTIVIKKKFRLTNEQARDGLYRYSIENTDLEKYCIAEPTCQQGKYRTIDGSCNNLQRPLWAKSNTAFERLLPPVYDDGLHQPRTQSVAQGELPSARWVSWECAKGRNAPDPQYTLILMQWGQFMDHDLTLAASTRAATGQGLICCHPRTQRKVEHHACFPIEILQNDPFYARHNQKCMHFVRNAPAPRSGCSLGHREQMNTLTHIIDGSMVYGSTQERAKTLRLFRGGQLKMSNVANQRFLPLLTGNQTDDCSIEDPNRFKCFIGGDVRVNEQNGLTMMHALLLREHNRIAEELARLNPQWSDNHLFQETRRIVIAEIQHITFNEWLPIVIGPAVMKKFGILPKTFEHSFTYDPKTNPNILNEFATAAYRFHSLVQGTFRALDNNGRPTRVIKLSEIFNNPIYFYGRNSFEQLLNGFTTDPVQSWDEFVTEELTNHLFEERGTPFGMDLVALNIQRGRDHGLPGYNNYRRICGLQPARSFQDLDRIMHSGASQLFSKMYKHVDDIDLFIGGIHEQQLPEALVGPTFACIVGEQFRRAKYGDRFWYENGKLPHSFSESQLMEIRKASIASLICSNTESIANVQPLAFLRPGGWNQKIPCRQIARVNLSPWQNEKIWS